MPDRKRPQEKRDRRNNVHRLGAGVWVEPHPYTVKRHEVDGVIVNAELDWDHVERVPFIVKLSVEKTMAAEVGAVSPELLRKLTVPYLIAVASKQASFWVNVNSADEGPSTEERLEGESLEHWAARLFWHCTVTREQPARVIARVQGISEGSASQRLTVCRKMGLLEPDTTTEEKV